SMNGVNGWYSAKARNAAGIESVGTNPLPMNGRNTSGMGRLLADSTFLATRPNATDSQVNANVIIARMPTAATHSTGPAVGRNPTSSATPVTSAMLSNVWIMLPTTWPVSTDTRAIAIVRNRAMMPSVMSMATEIAVPVTAAATVIRMIPGAT